MKRLASATSTQGWNQNFGYDGFGNLTAKTGSGVAPVGSYPADPATNRLSGISYDTNGNQLYSNGNALVFDASNRMTSSSGQSLGGLYEYDASNKRVFQVKQHYTGSAWVTDSTEYYFYGITGQKLGTYFATVSGSGAGSSMSWSLQSTQVFFGRKLIKNPSGNVQENILESIGSYYPLGEDRVVTANDSVKFATYTRDSLTGLDYGVERYYSSGTARFSVPDPYGDNRELGVPTTWNMYLYGDGDPVNQSDPNGLASCGSQTFRGTTVAAIMNGKSELSYLAQVIWEEAGPVRFPSDVNDIGTFQLEQAYIGTALMNRWDLANGNLSGWNTQGQLVLGMYGLGGPDLIGVILKAAGNGQTWGIYTNGNLNSTQASRLQQSLSTDISVGTQIPVVPADGGTITSVGSTCFSIESAIVTALSVLQGSRVNPDGVILLSWDLGSANGSSAPPGETTIPKIRNQGNTFYGLLVSPPDSVVRPRTLNPPAPRPKKH